MSDVTGSFLVYSTKVEKNREEEKRIGDVKENLGVYSTIREKVEGIENVILINRYVMSICRHENVFF